MYFKLTREVISLGGYSKVTQKTSPRNIHPLGTKKGPIHQNAFVIHVHLSTYFSKLMHDNVLNLRFLFDAFFRSSF